MREPMLSRRGLITGLGALIAAPAIVRFASIMPVKALSPGDLFGADLNTGIYRTGVGEYFAIVSPDLFREFQRDTKLRWPNVKVIARQMVPVVGFGFVEG